MNSNLNTHNDSLEKQRATKLNLELTTQSKIIGSVIDVFCGAGCLSNGFHQEGFKVECGIDVDENCRYAFETNNFAEFWNRDVLDVKPADLALQFNHNIPSVLLGCAPCQPFSQFNVNREDPKWLLVDKLADLVEAIKPDIVSMENVPLLIRFKSGSTFRAFLRRLKSLHYNIVWKVMNSYDYGAPQTRRRLVVLGSRLGVPSLPTPNRDNASKKSVFETISHLPEISAGTFDHIDPLHRSRKLSPMNLRRIQASKPGGSWHDWNRELIPKCYQRSTGALYTAVYGRLEWDKPAPTLTTQFLNYGSGRYGHPVQDRALSIREGALLQTIPEEYALSADPETETFKTMGRMIGNAVPIALARALAQAIATHIQDVV